MAVQLVQFLQNLVQNKGSDLHLSSNSPPMVRAKGDLLRVSQAPLTPQDLENIVTQITSPQQRAELAKDKMLDFAFKAPGIGIFRTNVFFQRNGLAVVMRILTEQPPTFEELKLPEICKTACSYANGLVLVTGPTGSGKSTTLAAMLNWINQTVDGHILTLEDPIEFQYDSKKCMVNQRSLGAHFTTFASAMKAALREDPDIILVGEMRDPETIELAIKAAETGHLVFSTLHTNSATKTIDRIINVFPADQQSQIRTVLSETLKVVIAQKLIPTADKKGRVAIHDVLVNTPAVANLIREGKTFQLPSIQQTSKREGMQQSDRILQELVDRGEVSGQIAWEYANEKKLFERFAPKGAAESGPTVAPPGTVSGQIPRPPGSGIPPKAA
jgi:twitching motility protein PilT